MNKKFEILAWAFGTISTIVLAGIGIDYFIKYLGDPDQLPLHGLIFNKTRHGVALETVKILLPMTSGYVIVVAPVVKYLKDEKIIWSKSVITGIVLTFSFGIIAIGLWSGVLAYLVDAARGFDENLGNIQEINLSWNKVGVFSSLAHLSFFTSVSWFISTAILTLTMSWKKDQNKTNHNV